MPMSSFIDNDVSSEMIRFYASSENWIKIDTCLGIDKIN